MQTANPNTYGLTLLNGISTLCVLKSGVVFITNLFYELSYNRAQLILAKTHSRNGRGLVNCSVHCFYVGKTSRDVT